MKKSRILMLIALLLIISLGAFYVYKINVFDQSTLKSIDIRTGDFSVPAVYQLEDKDADKLFNSLSSIVATDISDISTLSKVVTFDMTLLNRWDLAKNYSVYFADDHTIYLSIENEKTIYQIEDTDFFYSHMGFDAYYASAIFADFNVSVNQLPVNYSQSSVTWSFRRLDNSWQSIEPPAKVITDEKAILTEANSRLELNFDKLPSEAYLRITDTKDASTVFEGVVNVNELPVPEFNGLFSYDLNLTWSSEDLGYKGFAALNIPVEVKLSESYVLSKSILKQGDMLTITALHADNASIITLDQTLTTYFKWYQGDNVLRGYIPTNYNTEIGVYTLTFTNTETGTVSKHEIEIVSRDFKEQIFSVDTTVQENTQNDAAYEEYRNVFKPVRKVSADKRYYTEPFIFPTTGRLSTEFGETRIVNGKPTNYNHMGLDIAAATGTEVVATNAGKVVLSQELILVGNTVIIDHGEGLLSIYQHMDSRTVELGEMVTLGQPIGTVGSTGFSSGAHLHFAMSLFDVDLEPGYFIFGEAVTKENYETLTNKK